MEDCKDGRVGENGDWLRLELVFTGVFGLPTVPVPFFGPPADIRSEPVPIFH